RGPPRGHRAPVPRVRGRGRRVPRADADRVRARTRREAEVAAVGERTGGGVRRRRAEEARMGDPPRDEVRFETAAIHAGQDPEALYGSVNVPIYQTSTYAQERVGEPKVWDYARGGNPTRAAFEAALAALEGGERCLAFASGMAAETTLLLTLRPGDHVLLADDVYGGTYRLLSRVLEPWGLGFETCDMTDPSSVRDALRDDTRFVWIETPSNPLLKIVDIAAVASFAHER